MQDTLKLLPKSRNQLTIKKYDKMTRLSMSAWYLKKKIIEEKV